MATFAEATGVTHFSGTVIRQVTGEGTLVIEVDDPTVQVSLDGNQLNITGAGLQELKLIPGQYKFQATRDGKPVKTELVTITRGDRQMMRVSLEPVEEDFVADQPDVSLPSSDILFSDDWTWTEPVNLGPNVNSESGETEPCLSSDGLTLIFTSDRLQGFGQWDLWMCQRTSRDEDWGSATNLGPQVNSERVDTDSCLSADGLTLIFASDRRQGFGHWDLWICTRKDLDSAWTSAVNLGPVVNSRWGERDPSLSSDGLALLLSCDRPDGSGKTDLWLSHRDSLSDEWLQPVRLQGDLNSEYQENDPELSSDGKALIFSSSRSSSNHTLDLWISRGASPFGPWSEPVNLGPSVNRNQHDCDATLSADGQTLLFTSGRPGNLGGHDLWMSHRVPKVDHVKKAIELAEQGQLDKAAQEFSLALDSVSKDNSATTRSAILDEIWPNEELCQRVIDLRPADIDLWRDRAHLLAREARWKEASECFAKRLELGPDGAGSWANYAMAVLAGNDIDGYQDVCLEILQTFAQRTSSHEVSWALWSLAAIPGAVTEPQAAFALAERAYRETPGDLLCQRTYAMWLYRTDRLDEAIAVINQLPKSSLTTDTYNRDITYFAVMAHARRGEVERARTWAKLAFEWTAFTETGRFNWAHREFANRLSDEMNRVLAEAAEPTEKPAANDAAKGTEEKIQTEPDTNN